MNSGGLAAVLPSTSVVEEESAIIPNGITYTDERFSARRKERRAPERTKERQENAQIERLKKERAEMQKYRRRYLEAAMKQYMEQQTKPREMVSSIIHSHSHHHPQLLSSSQSYPGCVQVLRTTTPFAPDYPSISAFKPNIRKRPFEGTDGWMHYTHMTVMNDPCNIYHGKEPEMLQNGVSPMQITNSFKYSISKEVPYCPASSYNGGAESSKSMTKEIQQMNCIVPELERAEQYDQARLGSSTLPTTSQAQESVDSTISEEMSNLSAMPELAESHVKDLMDQIGPNNSLDDLGGNCLEGVLVNRCDEQSSTLAAETEILKMQSTNNSIISPISATCDTPNSTLSPAHLSTSARCSTNSFYDSHSAVVTPQQSSLTPPCDQPQQIAVTSAVPAASIMVQENSALYTRNVNSNSSTNNISSTNAVSLTPSLIGNANVTDGNNSVNGCGIYSNAAAIRVSGQQLHQPQQQQQHYQFTHFQQYHHSRHQQQQLINLVNSGCHVSANNAPLSHLGNSRICNAIEYPRFGHCYNQCNNNNPNKSSIFPQIPSQALAEYSTSQQYNVHSMKYPNNGAPYYAQRPEVNVQSQAYQCNSSPAISTSAYHHHHYYDSGGDPMTAAQNSVYPNHF
ncbi:hypothetical protein DINM_002063 [Dirofilaria immitis]|nr:hypothetical protein [Dirofilaria immitis]